MAQHKTFLAFSCIHFPFELKPALKWLLEQAELRQPDVLVNLGDSFDGMAAARWPNEAKHDLRDEYILTNEFLETIRKRSAKAGKSPLCVWTAGNHEDNVLSENRIPPDLRSLCDWRSLPQYLPEAKNWRIHDYCYPTGPKAKQKSVYRLGQVSFLHGYKTCASADADACWQYGQEYGLTVQGHTHRPTDGIKHHYVKSMRGTRQYVNVGTFCDPEQMQYVRRKDHSQWWPTICVGNANPIKSPRESRHWSAEQIRMPGEEY